MTPRRQLNVRFAAILFASVVVVAGLVHLVHGAQSRRSSAMYLKRAQTALENSNWSLAVRYFSRYLGYAPNDVAAMREYGLALDKSSVSPRDKRRAFLILDRALSLDPDRPDLRRRVAKLAMEMGRYPDAREHLNVLRKASPEDPELEQMLAECHEGSGSYTEAAELYQAAIQHAPGSAENYLRLARLYRRRLNQPLDADRLIDKMLSANPESHGAYLARFTYRREFVPSTLAEDLAADVDRALELAPDDADVLAAAAELAMSRDDGATARKHLEHGMEFYPDDQRFYMSLAELELREGHSDEALQVLRSGLDQLPGNVPLTAALASLQIDRGEITESRELIRALRKDGYASPPLSLLDARILVRKGQWVEAARTLEQAVPLMQNTPDLALQANGLLAMCYGEIGNIDRQLTVYRQLVNANPTRPEFRLAVGATLISMDRIEEALREYRQTAAMGNATAATALGLCRAIILHNLRQAPAERDWREVNELLNRAAEALPDSADVVLLRVMSLSAQQKEDEARQLLDSVRNDQSDRIELWFAAADLADRNGDWDGGSRILDEAEQKFGDSAELRVARAGHWTYRSPDEALAGLEQIERGAMELPVEQRSQVYLGLLDARKRMKTLRGTDRLLIELAKMRPFDLRVRQQLFDLAAKSGDDARMKQVLDQVTEIEGRGGATWKYAEAVRLVTLARKTGDKKSLGTARNLLTELAARSTWRQVPRALGDLEELEGNRDQAIEQYLRAIELGDMNLELARRATRLLIAARRFNDADKLLAKVQQRTSLPPDLQRSRGAVSLEMGEDPEHAEELAREAVESEPSNYENHLWLGLVLMAAGKSDEVEAPLRRATQLGEKVPATWITLVRFLVNRGQHEQAEAVAEEASRRLPRSVAELTRTICTEALGRTEEAEKQLRNLAAAQPTDPTVLQTVAEFYMRTRLASAEPYLRQMLEKSGDENQRSWARRSLATVLTSYGDYQRLLEAIELVDQNLAANARSVEDQRLKAVLLTTRRPRHSEAIRVLEGMAERRQANSQDQSLLAQLYLDSNNWTRARPQLLLVAAGSKDRMDLARLVRGLLSHGETDEAQSWFKRLEQMAPDHAETRELHARLLIAQGLDEKAIASLADPDPSSASGNREQQESLSRFASVLEEFGQSLVKSGKVMLSDEAFRQAEKHYRKTATDKPESLLPLALFLARRGRVSDALDICDQASVNLPPEKAAAAYVSSIRLGKEKVTGADLRRVETWLESAMQKDPNASLPLAMAQLRSIQGRTQDAESLYRQVLDTDKRNPMALNNLAWLWARRGNGAPALPLINLAIEILGPEAALLDTRGMVYMSMGQSSQAVADLERAVELQPGPTRFLHLAQAYHMSKDQRAAEAMLERMRVASFDVSELDAIDRADYQKLLSELSGVESVNAGMPN